MSKKNKKDIPAPKKSVFKKGHRHLIECRCVLPQFKNKKEPPKHKFIVFSVLDEHDNVELKYSQCNNCGIIHKVTDICKSEIQTNKENSSFILSVEDIKLSLPRDLSIILEKYKVDISSWEQASFIIENKEWGNFIILEQETEDGNKLGKYVRILGENFFKIENFSRNDLISLG